VPNWLDKADYEWGVIQLRWFCASNHPDPIVTKVPVGEVRLQLPADTPLITEQARARQLEDRREAALLRRIW
jgi:hypothetical protein